MKAKVIVENGYAKIVLTPECNFEKDMIEGFKDEQILTESTVSFRYDEPYGCAKNHEIEINIFNKDEIKKSSI